MQRAKINMLLFQLIFFSLFYKIILCDEGYDQYQLIDDMKYSSCDPNSSSMTTSFQYFGSSIFDSTTSSIPNFAVAGWFLLKGYNNKNYNLVSVFEQSNILVFKIEYDVNANTFTSTFLTQTPQLLQQSSTPFAFNFNIWYFANFQIQYISGLGIVFNANIYQTVESYYSIQQTTTLHSPSFSTNGLVINIGYIDDLRLVQESCTMLKQVYLYWNLSNKSLFSLTYDLSAMDTTLIWYFDLFYSQQNSQNIVYVNDPMGKLPISLSSQSSQSLKLSGSQQFTLDQLNVKQNYGFVLSFHVKVENPQNILYCLFQFKSISFEVDICNLNQLCIGQSKITGISYGIWNQMTFIFKQGLDQQLFAILNDDYSQIINFQFTNTFFYLCQIIFGDSTNSALTIQLAHIRVYEGVFLTQTSSCYLMAARSIKTCIICRNGYLLDYQNNFTCVLPSSTNLSTLVNNVKDWFPKQFQCYENMILDSQSGECVCLSQFYRSGNQCIQCPNFCKGCTDSNTCIVKDPNRQIDNLCPGGYFDDGYNCKLPTLNIKSRVNVLKQFSQASFCPPNLKVPPEDYYIANSSLNLVKNQGFFFCFIVKIITLTNGTLAYLRDQSIDYLTILLNTFIDSNGLQINQIVFQIIGLPSESFNIFTYQQNVWIGFWTDFNSATMYINNNSQNLTRNTNVSTAFNSYTIASPYLCIGQCFSNLNPSYICGVIAKALIIQNTSNLNYQVDHFTQLFVIAITVIKINFWSLPNSNIIMDTNNNLSMVISQMNQSINFIIDRFKGIQFTTNVISVIQGINFSNYYPTISCSLYIEKLNRQVQIFTYQLTNSAVQYILVPYGNRAFIRICYFNVCYDAKNALLNLNDYNFLYIMYQKSNNLEQSANYQIDEFQIICNYQKDTIKVVSQQQAFPTTVTFIVFLSVGSQIQDDFSIYLNSLILNNGFGSYYIDENESENCYLFENVSSLTCIYPKKGYVFYNSQAIISMDECNNLTNELNSLHVVNQSTYECINTGLSPNCIKVSSQSTLVVCEACKYHGQIATNNCNCPNGYFQNASTLSCEQCSPGCLTCSGTYDNCLTCKYSNQSPPSCGCNDTNYYLDNNYVCQQCSYQCSSCLNESTLCTSCSTNRSQVPDCNCQEAYYQVGEHCVPLTCESKCQGCSLSPTNCSACKSGRVNPPLCNCEINFTPNSSNGTCTPCPSGHFYNSLTDNCDQCSTQCKECVSKSNYCTSCQDGLLLQMNSCQCQNGKSISVNSNNQATCIDQMNVTLKVSLQTTYYQLILSFDYDIQSLSASDFSNISKLITLSFSQIPSNYYKLTNPSISGKILTLDIDVLQSFQTLQGFLIFTDNTKFISTSGKFVLNKNYTTNPLVFKIGPFVFNSNNLGSKSVDQVSNFLKGQNDSMLTMIKQFQVIFYLLNTLQPTVIFLLLNVQFPPNLYKFYQMVGLMIFPEVTDYQSNSHKNSFELFFIHLEDKDISISDKMVYQRLGFSKSFLINAQGNVIKFVVLALLILITTVLKMKVKKDKISKVFSVIKMLLQKINSEIEASILIIVVCILIQFQINEQTQWTVRYGYYLSITFVIILSYSFYQNYHEINNKQEFDKEDFSYSLIERIPSTNNKLFKNFFLLQLAKKYVLIFTLFAFSDYPIIVCVLNGTIQLVSSISTYIFKPYPNICSRFIKILGEMLISSVWFLHIPIPIIEKQIYKESVIDNDLIKSYALVGQTIIVLLIIFNLIFLIEKMLQLYNSLKEVYQNIITKKDKSLKIAKQIDISYETERDIEIEQSGKLTQLQMDLMSNYKIDNTDVPHKNSEKIITIDKYHFDE